MKNVVSVSLLALWIYICFAGFEFKVNGLGKVKLNGFIQEEVK